MVILKKLIKTSETIRHIKGTVYVVQGSLLKGQAEGSGSNPYLGN